MYKYKIFTMNVLTDIKFEFDEESFEKEDIVFRLMKPLNKPLIDIPMMEIKKIDSTSYMVDIHNVAEFVVNHNDEVDIYPYEKETHLNEIALHLLGNIFALIMFRREMFVLHGSCINIDGKGLIITGEGGAGKSTLARGFTRNGYKVVTDDLAFINNDFEVLPSYPSQKLWKDSMDDFGLNDYSQPIYSREQKFNVLSGEMFSNEFVPLKYVVLLEVDDVGVTIQEYSGMKKLDILLGNAYRDEFLGMYDLEIKHLQFMADLSKQIRVFRLGRPQTGFTVQLQIDAIMRLC